MKFYVNVNAPREGNGSKETPFRHINDAARVAQPGDEVLVAPGIYRECVSRAENAPSRNFRLCGASEKQNGERSRRDSLCGKDL